jgi:hypothetical protein
MVVRTYAPVGKRPILHEHLSRDHLSAMSGITLEGKLYMLEQERAFKGEDVVRFLKHLMRQIPGKLLVIWQGGRLLGCDWSNYPVMLRISTPTKESGST